MPTFKFVLPLGTSPKQLSEFDHELLELEGYFAAKDGVELKSSAGKQLKGFFANKMRLSVDKAAAHVFGSGVKISASHEWPSKLVCLFYFFVLPPMAQVVKAQQEAMAVLGRHFRARVFVAD